MASAWRSTLMSSKGWPTRAYLLEVPLAEEVLALLLLGSLPNNWQTLVVTLGNIRPEGKHLTLEQVKSTLLNEVHFQLARPSPKRWLEQRERPTEKSPDREKFRPRSKSKGRLTCFHCGNPGHFQKNYRHYRKDKGGVDGVEPKKIPDNKNTLAIVVIEEELLFISEQNEVNLAGEESTWVVDSDASFHLTPNRECFLSYMVGDHEM